MSSSIPSPSIVLEEISQLAPPGTPLTTPEIADEFDCTDRTIYNRLDTLVDTGVIETKKVGARGRVWWRPLEKHGLNNNRESEPKAIITNSTDSDGTRDQLREREEELAAELDATKQLQEISTRLIQKDDTDALYDEILDAVVTIMDADFARLQLRDPNRGGLQLLAHHGFDKATALWDRVTPESNGPCGVSLETSQRVIVPDVETCEFMAGTEDQETYLNTGIRAIQSTPLVSRNRDVVGMLSTHWQTPHDPAERDLRSLDVLARQATDLINHQQAKEALRRNQQLLAGEKRVLKKLVQGASLDDVLTTLIKVVEEYTEGMPGSILITQPGKERFGTVIGPNLPHSYTEALESASIAPPYVGPCSKAAHVGETVGCDNAETDTRWASEWRELALSHDLHSCYSTPIVGTDQTVLGSFGLYSTQTSDVVPDPEIREVISDIAGVAIERKQTEEKLRESEERYRKLFESVDQGFCVIKMLFDEDDNPVDYRFLETNPAFEKHTGLTNAEGKRMRELESEHEQYWFDIYGEIAQTGESKCFEQKAHAFEDRWYAVNAFQHGGENSHQVAILFENITERKQREERERFRTTLTDTLQSISDPVEIQAKAARILGEHLDVDRALYNEILADENTGVVHADYYSDDLASVVGRHQFDDFGEHVSEAFQSGETQVVDDYATIPGLSDEEQAAYREIDLQAYIGVPLVKDDRLTAFFTVNQTTSREWTETEIALVEETAERTWNAVERAHAEQALKQTNTGLERLTIASRELMDASTQDITDRAAKLTQTVLDVEYTAFWRYDETTGEFQQHTRHTAPETDLDSNRFPAEFSKQIWQAFINNETTVENDIPLPELENERELGGEHASRAALLPLQSHLLIPVGRHGVICAGSTHTGTFDEQTIDLANTLAATLETAWNRAADEQQLARQNEELARLDRLNGLIREISNALVQANSRAAIDRAVCDRLAASDQYAFVWIGEHDSVTETISPREWGGIDSSYIDDLATQLNDTSASIGRNPIATAVETRDIQVVPDIATETRFTPLREATLERGARSCISVPLIYEESVYGVLSIYADHPRPDKRDPAVLAELGQMIAHAINAVETKETRHANRVVELTLQFQEPTTPLCRLAQQTGCDIEFEGLVHHSDGNPDIFFTTNGVSPEKLVTASEQVRTIAELRCLTAQADTALFRARVSEPTLAARIVEQDGVVRTLTIEDGTATAVVDISHTATVREFIERLQQGAPSLELLARQTQDRSLKTRSTFRSICEESLTAKQLAALQTAYFSGFFESPRTNTGQEVAASLNVSQPTFTAHLRAAERGVCNLLFAAEGTTAGL